MITPENDKRLLDALTKIEEATGEAQGEAKRYLKSARASVWLARRLWKRGKV